MNVRNYYQTETKCPNQFVNRNKYPKQGYFQMKFGNLIFMFFMLFMLFMLFMHVLISCHLFVVQTIKIIDVAGIELKKVGL